MTFNNSQMARIRNYASTSSSGSDAYKSTDTTQIEARLQALEEKAHKPCQGNGGSAKVNAEELPGLPPRKSTAIHDRLNALEARLEALIKKLS